MPTEPYIAHPTVEPAPRPPDDYFHLEANPERFAAAARGLQEFGKGITQADDNWQEMRKDAALNAALKESEAAVEEYGKMRGADAVAAEKTYRQTVDQIFQRHGENLPPKWRTEFDTIGRRYQYGVLNGKMSTHAITQGLEVTNQTNKATMERAGDQASNNYNNPDEESLDKNRPIPSARQLARQGALKAVQANGNAGVPEIVDEAIKNADAYFYSTTATAKYENNAPDGRDYVLKHVKEMGAEGVKLLLKFDERANKQQDDAAADVRIKMFQTNDPDAQRKILYDNKSRLRPDDFQHFNEIIPGGTTPAQAPTTNVMTLRPSAAIQPGESPADYAARMLNEPAQKPATQPNAPLPGESPSDQAARAAKQGLETLKAKTPVPRQPNESPGDWKKRNSSQNFTPAPNQKTGQAIPFGEEQSKNYSPAQMAIARALDGHTDKDLEVRKLPGNVLETARDVALHSGPGGLQQFMKDQGFPKAGSWCGEFAAAVVKSAGGTPPRNPEVASNWRGWGQPTAEPKSGDIAVRRVSLRGQNVPTGQTGSHVTFVEDYNPRTGTFTGIGGNQGRARSTFNIADFEFRSTGEQRQAAQ